MKDARTRGLRTRRRVKRECRAPAWSGEGRSTRRGPVTEMEATNMRWNASSRWWIAAGLCAAASGSAGGSYLALDGPPPLRFVSRMKTGVVKVVLPPLALTSADTAATTGGSAESVATEDAGEATVFGPAPPPGPANSEQIVIPPAAMNPQTMMPGFPVTPQVLLSYFGSPGTNGVNPVVLAPVSFVPPQPSASGSSRATYRQVP